MNNNPGKQSDRTKPPVPGEARDVLFPDYFEKVLNNGLKVIVYQRSDFPTVTMNAVMRGGAYFDGDVPGLATMSAELLTKGTATRSATRIVEEVEFLGGSIASGAGWDSTSVGVSILSKYCDEALEVLTDVLRNPAFPEEELERAQDQRIAAILQRKSSPGTLAQMQFARSVFKDHPYAQASEGTEESIRAMTREQLSSFHKRIFSASNMFIIAVGDVDPESFCESVQKLFGDLPASDRLIQEAAAPPARRGIEVQIVDRPQAVQSSVIVGHIGIERKNPDYIAVSVMNTLFGGYFGSRLNLNLREDKGYTYGAHSRFEGRMQPGPFMSGAEVRNEATEETIVEIIAEIKSLVDVPVKEEELESVQNYITGSFPIQIETPGQVAQRIIQIEMYDLGKTYYNTYNSKVLQLTTDDIQKTAQKYLFPDELSIIASGRGALLTNTLSRFGSVEIFDVNGNKIPNV
jgi:zinc protease